MKQPECQTACINAERCIDEGCLLRARREPEIVSREEYERRRDLSTNYSGFGDLDVSLKMDPNAVSNFPLEKRRRWARVVCFFHDHEWSAVTDHCGRCGRSHLSAVQSAPTTLHEFVWRLFHPFD